MDEPNLFVMCLNAFVAVLVLLSLLALVMRLLGVVFPPSGRPAGEAGPGEATTAADPALAAAITTATQSILPGGRITRIEEIPGRQ